ncbi:MAG TPA: GPP34 family phosphoprotein, partial [Pseudonocardiaceae bacterium]|nr:GPP34 family phosphoprotein [Pseudonocardiaceae bacterium]
MELTLAESVLLLALDDVKGSTGSTPIDPGLAGALLVDLGRLGALHPVGKQLHPVEGVGIEHPVLARAATAIAASKKPRTAKSWVGRLPRELKPLSGTVARPLVDRGILAEQRIKVLGLFPSPRFPEMDPDPERMLRSQLREVLLGGRAPQEQDALLLGLLMPLELVDRLVERPQCREARKRAKEIAATG